MEKKTVRSGIVGAGFSAAFHFEALKKLHGVSVEPVGVFAIDTEMAESYARQRGIRAFETLEALIEAVDVVHVCAPVSAHESITIAALEAGRFAICEKPLTAYCGDGSEGFRVDACDKEVVLVPHRVIGRVCA